MLAVLSYGTQHEITMVDGKNVNPEMIVQRFSGEQLPELAEKPKIFIIHTDHGRYQLAYINYVTMGLKRGVYLIAGAPSMTMWKFVSKSFTQWPHNSPMCTKSNVSLKKHGRA